MVMKSLSTFYPYIVCCCSVKLIINELNSLAFPVMIEIAVIRSIENNRNGNKKGREAVTGTRKVGKKE